MWFHTNVRGSLGPRPLLGASTDTVMWSARQTSRHRPYYTLCSWWIVTLLLFFTPRFLSSALTLWRFVEHTGHGGLLMLHLFRVWWMMSMLNQNGFHFNPPCLFVVTSMRLVLHPNKRSWQVYRSSPGRCYSEGGGDAGPPLEGAMSPSAGRSL